MVKLLVESMPDEAFPDNTSFFVSAGDNEVLRGITYENQGERITTLSWYANSARDIGSHVRALASFINELRTGKFLRMTRVRSHATAWNSEHHPGATQFPISIFDDVERLLEHPRMQGWDWLATVMPWAFATLHNYEGIETQDSAGCFEVTTNQYLGRPIIDLIRETSKRYGVQRRSLANTVSDLYKEA